MNRFQCFLALGFLAASPLYAQNQVDKIRKEFLNANSKTILIASHRAVHHQLPENSIAAIKEAIRLGVDIAEIDIKVSKDGIPMLMHDGKIDRTTNGKGDLEDQNFDDLRKLRLVANGQVTDQQIPTLEEVLNIAKGNILIDLDLKTDHINPIIEVVKKTRTQDIVFFFDSNYDMLAKVDSASRDFMLMPRAYNQSMADSAIKRFGPQVIHIDPKFYTTEVCGLIKKGKARIWINSLGETDAEIRKGNEKAAMANLVKNGANIIQTDEPEKWIKALQKDKLHW